MEKGSSHDASSNPDRKIDLSKEIDRLKISPWEMDNPI